MAHFLIGPNEIGFWLIGVNFIVRFENSRHAIYISFFVLM